MLTRRAFILSTTLASVMGGLPACAVRRAQARARPLTAAAHTYDEQWTDISRSRTVPVRLHVPTLPGPWPVVLYSHGLGGNREGGALWGSAWAQAGLLSIHLQHVGSDTQAVRNDAAQAAAATEHAQRLADVRFALDELTRRQKIPGALYRQANLQAVGLAGHSFGARTTLALAAAPGTRLPGMAHEPRLKAFIALSPADLGSETHRSLRGPLLLITGTQDADMVGNGTTPQSRQEPFADALPGNKYLLVLDGADHYTFAGNTVVPPRLARQRPNSAVTRTAAHHQAVQTLTSTFWQAMLNHDPQLQQQAQRLLNNPAGLAPADIWNTK
jgi:predicted dienelactone hydrolase